MIDDHANAVSFELEDDIINSTDINRANDIKQSLDKFWQNRIENNLNSSLNAFESYVSNQIFHFNQSHSHFLPKIQTESPMYSLKDEETIDHQILLLQNKVKAVQYMNKAMREEAIKIESELLEFGDSIPVIENDRVFGNNHQGLHDQFSSVVHQANQLITEVNKLERLQQSIIPNLIPSNPTTSHTDRYYPNEVAESASQFAQSLQ